MAGSSPSFRSGLVRHIISKEMTPAPPGDIETFFGPDRMPGTSSIGERKRFPELFQDTPEDKIETYDHWLDRTLNSTVLRLAECSPAVFPMTSSSRLREKLIETIRIILDFTDQKGEPLCELIPQQMYEDVFIRMIMMIVHKDMHADAPCLYGPFNRICHRLAVSLVSRLDTMGCLRETDSGIGQLIHIAVLCGYVGINLKSSASAASTLLNRELIPIKRNWIKDMRTADEVPDRDIDIIADKIISISKGSEEPYGLDSIQMYFKEVVQTNEPTLLVFFSDDYMETVIDLKRFELMMRRNDQLRVLFVPRNGRYGNDFAFEDMPPVLDNPFFKELLLMHRRQRFVVSPDGPMSGCVDVRYISSKLIRRIETLAEGRNLIIETKGCRNFEMLQGQLTVPWYTSFNCNRSLSIRTVGIDMAPVFLRIPPGLKAFDGFAATGKNAPLPRKNRGVRFARMTTKKLYNALTRNDYLERLKASGSELKLHRSLMRICKQKKMTISEFIFSGELGNG